MRRAWKSAVVVAPVLVLAGLVGGVAGAAQAQPAGLYAPSSLVLTVGEGEDARSATVTRAVILSCAPRARGTHPSPRSACSELRRVDGGLDALVAAAPEQRCSREWAPQTVTVDGVWQGTRVTWERSFSNACQLRTALEDRALFAF